MRADAFERPDPMKRMSTHRPIVAERSAMPAGPPGAYPNQPSTLPGAAPPTPRRVAAGHAAAPRQ
jgi:hypothetical protein